MSKTIRESEMLKEVRCWRAQVFGAVCDEAESARAHRTRELARRLNLPLADSEGLDGAAHTTPDGEDAPD